MTREIVFDTETTGFEYAKGERLVEIGAVELINHMPTGVTYHQYINPEKEVPEEAFKVHGLSYDFLKIILLLTKLPTNGLILSEMRYWLPIMHLLISTLSIRS